MDFQNYLAYANINEVSLKDAWHCEKITNLRKQHLQNSVKGTICQRCISNKYCKVNPVDRKLSTVFNPIKEGE